MANTISTKTAKAAEPTLDEQAIALGKKVFGDGPIYRDALAKADAPEFVKLRLISMIVVDKPWLAGYLSLYVRKVLNDYATKLAETDIVPAYHGGKVDEAEFKKSFMTKLNRIACSGTAQVCSRGYLVAPGFSTKVGGDK